MNRQDYNNQMGEKSNSVQAKPYFDADGTWQTLKSSDGSHCIFH